VMNEIAAQNCLDRVSVHFDPWKFVAERRNRAISESSAGDSDQYNLAGQLVVAHEMIDHIGGGVVRDSAGRTLVGHHHPPYFIHRNICVAEYCLRDSRRAYG